MRKLFVLLLLVVLTFACAPSGRSTVKGGTPEGRKERTAIRRGQDRQQRSSLRKFERDWKARYSEKTVRKVYGLSKRQLEVAKKRLRKKKPTLATKATQNPRDYQTPDQAGR